MPNISWPCDRSHAELLLGNEVTKEYTTIQALLDKPAEDTDLHEKLQEINGNVIKMSAKLDGRRMI